MHNQPRHNCVHKTEVLKLNRLVAIKYSFITEKKKENIINTISDNLVHIEQPKKYSQAEFTKTRRQEDRKQSFKTLFLP